MEKQTAIQLLGGTNASAARQIGISKQAVGKWPDPLTDAIHDRVIAVFPKQRKPVPEILLPPLEKSTPEEATA